MKKKLKTCEQCRGKARDRRDIYSWVVECTSCGRQKYGSTRSLAIAAWNRRSKLKETFNDR